MDGAFKLLWILSCLTYWGGLPSDEMLVPSIAHNLLLPLSFVVTPHTLIINFTPSFVIPPHAPIMPAAGLSTCM